MLKVKKRIIRGYMLLGICSMNIVPNYSDIEAEKIQINKFIASKYQSNSNVENVESKGDTEFLKESTETLFNIVDEVSIKTQELKITKAKSQEDKKKKWKPIKAELTAYCNDPRCSDQWGSQTAMQTRTRLGVIAAPSNIPLGSKMYIPELANYKEDGMFDVEDRGGAIKIKKDGTYVIDVWVPTYKEAVKFGRKKTTIYLVE